MGEDHAIDVAVKETATVSVAPEDKVAAAAPVVGVEDYELKYHIKYTVKSLVDRNDEVPMVIAMVVILYSQTQ